MKTFSAIFVKNLIACDLHLFLNFESFNFKIFSYDNF